MALTDCPKCWETPCICGYEYRKNWSIEQIEKQIEMLERVLGWKRKNLTVNEK